MSKISRFEDLIAWQKAKDLTSTIYEITTEGDFAKDLGLAWQIRRAVVSIMSNIAEGFERNRRGEFHQFLSIAKASCAGVRSHLYVAYEAGCLDSIIFNRFLAQAEEVGKIIGGLRVSVERERDVRVNKGTYSTLSTQSSALNKKRRTSW